MDDVAKPIIEKKKKMLESKYSEASDKRHGQNIYPVLPSAPTEDNSTYRHVIDFKKLVKYKRK